MSMYAVETQRTYNAFETHTKREFAGQYSRFSVRRLVWIFDVGQWDKYQNSYTGQFNKDTLLTRPLFQIISSKSRKSGLLFNSCFGCITVMRLHKNFQCKQHNY